MPLLNAGGHFTGDAPLTALGVRSATDGVRRWTSNKELNFNRTNADNVAVDQKPIAGDAFTRDQRAVPAFEVANEPPTVSCLMQFGMAAAGPLVMQYQLIARSPAEGPGLSARLRLMALATTLTASF